MPVVVTGADSPLGAAVVAALCSDPLVEVRATVRRREAVRALAAQGAVVAVSDLADPRRAGAVLEGAHTVVHLDPAPLDHVLEAADGTSVRRLVLVLPAATTEASVSAAAAEIGIEAEFVTGSAAVADAGVVAAVLEADRRR